MTIQQKMHLILKLSGLTQEQLARKLGVTFVALNRWVNAKADPRPKAQEKINELYLQYSGQKIIPATLLDAKKELIKLKQRAHGQALKSIINRPDVRDELLLSLTYHSNKIEGSTLSEDETADILFRNAIIPNKSLSEHLEAKNHQTALEFLFTHLAKKNPLTESLLLRIHTILLNGIRDDAGAYRTYKVRIMSTYVPTAKYLKIPALMQEIMHDSIAKTKDPIHQIAEVHSRFEQIHPFGDGNGRAGRLWMYAMAMKENLPPVVIHSEQRKLYMTYLNKSQMSGDISLLEDFICDALLDGYEIIERK
jgi:Fic family protein/DNA-binding XRE family transcriptional regulator